MKFQQVKQPYLFIHLFYVYLIATTCSFCGKVLVHLKWSGIFSGAEQTNLRYKAATESGGQWIEPTFKLSKLREWNARDSIEPPS